MGRYLRARRQSPRKDKGGHHQTSRVPPVGLPSSRPHRARPFRALPHRPRRPSHNAASRLRRSESDDGIAARAHSAQCAARVRSTSADSKKHGDRCRCRNLRRPAEQARQGRPMRAQVWRFSSRYAPFRCRCPSASLNAEGSCSVPLDFRASLGTRRRILAGAKQKGPEDIRPFSFFCLLDS